MDSVWNWNAVEHFWKGDYDINASVQVNRGMSSSKHSIVNPSVQVNSRTSQINSPVQVDKGMTQINSWVQVNRGMRHINYSVQETFQMQTQNDFVILAWTHMTDTSAKKIFQRNITQPCNSQRFLIITLHTSTKKLVLDTVHTYCSPRGYKQLGLLKKHHHTKQPSDGTGRLRVHNMITLWDERPTVHNITLYFRKECMHNKSLFETKLSSIE
jgi:hypothetical protein